MKVLKGEIKMVNTVEWLVSKVRELLKAQKDNNGGGGTTGDLTLEQARQNGNVLEGDVEFTSNKKIFCENIEENTYTSFYFEDGICGLITENLTSNYGASLYTSTQDVNVASNYPQSKGILGNEEFNKQGDRRAFAQLADVYDSNSYSTEEIKTGGTWIDGKPIYRKTVEITDFSSPDAVNGSLDLSIYFGNSIDNICNTPYFIVDHYSNYGYKSYGNVLNIDAILSVTDGPTQGIKGLNAIAINAPFGTAFDISTLTSLIITLEYTKTTD